MLDYHGNKSSPLSGFNPRKIALLSKKVLLCITGANIRGNKVDDIKEDVLEKTNDIIDKMKRN